MVRVSVGVLVTVLAACAIPMGAGRAADDVRLHSADSLSREAPTVQGLRYMDNLLRERSGGRLRIESFGEGDRSTDTFKVSQVRDGLLEMARVNLGVLDSLVPETAVLSLPYLFKSHSHLLNVLDGPIGDELLAHLGKLNLVGLCFYDIGSRSLYGPTPIRSAPDLRGLTVRVPLSTTAATIVRALGGTPVPMPDYQVRDAITTGAVDATVNTLSTYVAQKHYRVAHFFSATEHSWVPGVLIFSKIVWDRLSGDDQRLLRKAARDSVAYERDRLEAYEAAARQTAEADGAEFVRDVDRESFARVLRPLWHDMQPRRDDGLLLRRILGYPEIAHSPARPEAMPR